MNTIQIKLTDTQHKELQEIAKTLTNQYQIEKIICFAAINRSSEEATVFNRLKVVSETN